VNFICGNDEPRSGALLMRRYEAGCEDMRVFKRTNFLELVQRISSHSQNRITVQPAFLRTRFTIRSRSRLRESFGTQKCWRLLGMRECFGQPCQKQPSTNTARRILCQTKSGRPNTFWFRRQPLILATRKIEISRNSVRLLPAPRTKDMRFDRSA